MHFPRPVLGEMLANFKIWPRRLLNHRSRSGSGTAPGGSIPQGSFQPLISLARILRLFSPTCPRGNARKIFGRPKKFLHHASRHGSGAVPRLGPEVAAHGIGGNFRGNLRQHFPTPVIGEMLRKFPAGWKKFLATVARSSIRPGLVGLSGAGRRTGYVGELRLGPHFSSVSHLPLDCRNFRDGQKVPGKGCQELKPSCAP